MPRRDAPGLRNSISGENTTMTKPCSNTAEVLVVRPWFGVTGWGDGYAHFDALVMSRMPGQAQQHYADYQVLDRYDPNIRRTPRPDNFRFKCQVDDRHTEAYAWQWGYQPERSPIFDVRDLKLYGASITAIDHALTQMQRADGSAEAVGRFVVRLARALKVGGIALIETSLDGSFREAAEVQRFVGASDYSDAVHMIDNLVAGLHQTCIQRAGRKAA